MRKRLTKKIGQVIKDVNRGTPRAYQKALDKLQGDILSKMDGCADEGVPDEPGNDWIIDCSAQAQVYPLILQAIGLLET